MDDEVSSVMANYKVCVRFYEINTSVVSLLRTCSGKLESKAIGDSGKVYFYHYTSKEAAESIKKSRVIRKTVKMPGGGDANFGEGTYGTPLGPELGRQALAKNNYGYAWSGMEDQGRVDVAILIVFKDDGKIRHVRHEGREIYIYAEDVYLDNAEEVEKVDFKYL